MIRRFNYTNRIRINRADVAITVKGENGSLELEADLKGLMDYKLPPESLVFVEAYRQTNWMRFNYGQVGAITPPDDRRLLQFDSADGLLFRIKVIPSEESHLLLAEADQIPFSNDQIQESKRDSLLPVKSDNIGSEVYRLDFSGLRPILLVNCNAGHYAEIARSPLFVALAYPAILREILSKILLFEKHDDDENPDNWQSLWLKFSSNIPGVGDRPDLDDAIQLSQWIDDTVERFACQQSALGKFEEFWRSAQ